MDGAAEAVGNRRDLVLPALCGALSGAAIGLSFRSAAAAPLLFVAPVPLLWVALHRRRGALLAGACAGIAGYALAFGWLPAPLMRFQGLAAGWAWLILAAGVAYHAVQFILFAGAVALLASGRDRQDAGRRRWRGDLALAAGCAAAWVALEWVFPKVFPWSLGDALVGASRLRQGADLGGVHGLSFVVVLAAAWFALGLDRRLSWREGAIRLAVGATLPLLLIGYATARSTADPAPAARPVRVAVVQGAIPVDDATREEAAARGWQIYQRMTWALLAGAAAAPQLVIWPETTLPVPLRDDAWYRALVEQLAQGMGRTLILGALDRSSAPAGEMNSAYAVSPAGADRPAALRAYHKSHLMPWAEYVPGGDWLPLLRGWRTTGDLVPGAAGESFAVPVDGGTLRIAPSICVEGLRPGWFNDLVRGGAGVLLNLTDDGWLAGSPGPDLHLQLARMRAVETRRWLVRASNSGVSAVIDPHGEVVAALPFGEPGTLVVPVSPATAVTPYVRFGDWPVGVSAVVLAWLLFPVARRRMGARIRVGRPRPAHRPSGGRAADRPVIDRGKQPGWHR